MTVAAARLPTTTLDEFLAIPEDERFHELLAGELVQKAPPVARHGGSQVRVGASLSPFHRRSGGSGGPGGWRFATECEVQLAPHTVVRPDVSGWRRERLPRLPDTFPNPARETLRVHRWTPPGYQVILDAGRDAQVCAEPFDAIALQVADLFDDEN